MSARNMKPATDGNTTETQKPAGNVGGKPEASSGAFDPAAFRLRQDFGAQLGVKKVVVQPQVRRPGRHSWVFVHEDEEYRYPAAVIELPETNETYLVAPHLLEALSGEWMPKLLVSAVTRQGTFFIWPVKLPDGTGRIDSWNASAMAIINAHAGEWIRVVSQRDAACYGVFTTEADLPAPEWPDEPFEELLGKAFKGRIIDTLDHPLVRRLRGEE